MLRFFGHLRRAGAGAWTHDVLGQAKAAAYSAILSLFPAILVLTALLANAPDTDTLSGEIRTAFLQILPPGTAPLLLSYFQSGSSRPFQVIVSASIITLLAASSVMTTLIESFRRAYSLPLDWWGSGQRNLVAFLLVPLSLLPMTLTSLLVVFGHQIGSWLIVYAGHELHTYVVLLALMGRWTIAMLTSISVLAIIYHTGVPRTQSWRFVLPGAVVGTAIWFPATLLFGWYVTRYANYSVVYGSLGAAIALLIWLFILMISVMVGAEFNAQVYPKHTAEMAGAASVASEPAESEHFEPRTQRTAARSR